jgi:CspA family cold shock protein
MRAATKWFDTQKGYGFITDLDSKEDLFVHHSNIVMDGFRYLNEDDIVNYELGDGKNGREQAVNVRPILTRQMVVHELAKEGLHIMRIRDDKGIHGWYVVDKSDKPVVDKEMDFLEVAAFAGFSIR